MDQTIYVHGDRTASECAMRHVGLSRSSVAMATKTCNRCNAGSRLHTPFELDSTGVRD